MLGAHFGVRCHYPSFRHHYRFKILLHCRILIRQWHIGSDARWLLLPVLHPAVIRFRKQKKQSIKHAGWSMLAGYRRHYIEHFIQEKNSYITDKGRIQHIRKLIHKSIRASQTKEKGSTHHKSTHPQIDSYITDKGAGFNTNKITHLQIDSHNIEGGEGRPGGGDWGCRRAGQVTADSRRGRPQFRCRSGTALPHVGCRFTAAPPHHRCSAPLSPLQHLETKRGEPRREAGHQEGAIYGRSKGIKREDEDRPGQLTSEAFAASLSMSSWLARRTGPSTPAHAL